jgi:hypothetical protein
MGYYSVEGVRGRILSFFFCDAASLLNPIEVNADFSSAETKSGVALTEKYRNLLFKKLKTSINS